MSAPSRKPAPRRFIVTPETGTPLALTLSGRVAWALDRLRAAGPMGCTPIDQPAPRWSAYVHSLRAMGVPIETVNEPHAGPFAGTHGRYVVRAVVDVEGGAG